MPRSILIVGHPEGWNLEGSYARAFRELGWQVDSWDPMGALYRAARGSKLGKTLSGYVNVEPWRRKANLELLHQAQPAPPDLLLVIGTEGLRAGTLAQLRVQIPDTIVYCLFPDSLHNLLTERIQSFPLFDRVATTSPAWVEPLRKLGASRVEYLPFAADQFLHKPVETGGRNGSGRTDLAFIGNWRSEREQFLEHLVEFDLRLWGEDWWKHRTRRGSPLRSRWAGRPVFGAEFADVCANAKVLLNIVDSGTWPGPNMRTFEQPACGAFSLVTRSTAVTELFTEGENIECFDSVSEARDKIDFYLKHEDARQRVATNAYQFVVYGGHTYVDRARQLLAWAQEDGLLGG